MKVKTRVKVGGTLSQHNETLVRERTRAKERSYPQAQRPSLKVKTHLKAGGQSLNHNETLVRGTPRKRSRA